MPVDPVTLGTIFSLGKSVIERLFPDPHARAEEMRKLEELYQKGDLAELQAHVTLMQGQLRINEVEAGHKSLFVAGWRPFIGWVGGIGLAYQYLIFPFLQWIWAALQVSGKIPPGLEPPPLPDFQQLLTLLLGMLGIGWMRSHDKKNGTATNSIP